MINENIYYLGQSYAFFGKIFLPTLYSMEIIFLTIKNLINILRD